jgi:type I restriction enzyme, S subunit
MFKNKNDWKWVKLGEICELELGKTPPSKDLKYWSRSNDDYQWVSITDMSKNKLVETERKVTKIAFDSIFRSKIRKKGTLLMSFKLTIGKVIFLPFDAFHNEAIVSILPKKHDEVSLKYLFYILPKIALSGGSKKAIKGNTLNKNSLKNLEIPLPSLEHQREVVARCEAVERKQKKLLAINSQDKENISLLKQSVLSRAIRGDLVPQNPEDEDAQTLYQQIQQEKAEKIQRGELKKTKPFSPISELEIPFQIPKTWKWVRLGEIFDVRDGTHDTPKYVLKGYPLITSKNLSTDKFDLKNIKYISEDDYTKISQRSFVDIGDILFAMIGTIGNPVINDLDFKYAIKNVALFKKIPPINNLEFLFYFLKTSVEDMKNKAGGGVQSFVSLNFLREYLYPLPPLAEQTRIVEVVEGEMAKIKQMEEINTENKTHISKLLTTYIKEQLF